jgi:hypothetical protein
MDIASPSAALMRKKGMIVHKIQCPACDAMISTHHPGDLNRAKLEHLYNEHPLELAKNILQAVPKVKSLATQLGEMLRENLKP